MSTRTAIIEDSGSQVASLSDSELPAELEPLRLIGHGAMASVFLARDRALKRLVAVKVLRDELCADATCRQRFEREAQAAARLAHPAVTRVYSVGRLRDDKPFIVMEYIDGDNLADLLKSRGPLDAGETRRILRQLADGLAAAHVQNIVHRDIKPANVLIEHATGRVCLTDFGIAAILDTGSAAMTRLTRENDRLGDPRYMSPEQLRGEAVSGRSDVYGLGILGYELLTGRGPFDRVDTTDIAAAHLRQVPLDLTMLRPDLPTDLADVLRRCLAKRPEHRPRAEDVCTALSSPAAAPASPVEAADGGALRGFLGELKQRKVYRAAAGYAAATFLLLQVADLVLPPLNAPTIIYRALVVASLAGFPVAIALAWAFDFRGGRLVRAPVADSRLSGAATPAQRLLMKVLGLGGSVVLAVLLASWLLGRAA